MFNGSQHNQGNGKCWMGMGGRVFFVFFLGGGGGISYICHLER